MRRLAAALVVASLAAVDETNGQTLVSRPDRALEAKVDAYLASLERVRGQCYERVRPRRESLSPPGGELDGA